MRMHSWGSLAFGAALLLMAGCGSKAKVAGTPTNKVNVIELGRSLNADRTVKDPTDIFQPTDTIYASVETETLGSAMLTARWTFEDGQTVDSTTQRVPASGGVIRSEFHVWKPGGWPVGKYHLQITLDSTVSGVKEFTVK
ncbi:MAG TPA: hypothetical protein VGQ69_08345 [Gemmatimonadales bacterium]|jgi:hypothetical protein|nr:hypothetical protein [Gemmatimonadales bacterium]HEV8599353.1 hypothetical protein [Gemmatimonadales bacterium]